MEAAAVVDQLKARLEIERSQLHHVCPQPLDRHSGALRSPTGGSQRSLHGIDAGDLPTMLSKVDSLGPGTTAQVKRPPRCQRGGPRHQCNQLRSHVIPVPGGDPESVKKAIPQAHRVQKDGIGRLRDPRLRGAVAPLLAEGEGVAGDPRLEAEAEAMDARLREVDEPVELLAGNRGDALLHVLAGIGG